MALPSLRPEAQALAHGHLVRLVRHYTPPRANSGALQGASSAALMSGGLTLLAITHSADTRSAAITKVHAATAAAATPIIVTTATAVDSKLTPRMARIASQAHSGLGLGATLGPILGGLLFEAVGRRVESRCAPNEHELQRASQQGGRSGKGKQRRRGVLLGSDRHGGEQSACTASCCEQASHLLRGGVACALQRAGAAAAERGGARRGGPAAQGERDRNGLQAKRASVAAPQKGRACMRPSDAAGSAAGSLTPIGTLQAQTATVATARCSA